MKLLQLSRTTGSDCGLAVFAANLAENLRHVGVAVETVESLGWGGSADLVLVQHHDELFEDDEVRTMAKVAGVPLVVFAHSDGIGRLADCADGVIAMCSGMLAGCDDVPNHVFAHPAWTPRSLGNRPALRREQGLPQDRVIISTHGYLKFERRLLEIASALLAEAEDSGWFVQVLTSPWRLESPGLIEALRDLQAKAPGLFRHEHGFLDAETLNSRLQACDLLWCWTDAPSSPYASGVVSDQYASGTRLFVANKLQHGHVIGLPNVATGADDLECFIDGLKAEARRACGQRHDPQPVSWDNVIHGFAEFLRGIR